ncbi:MAG: YraN family protein [candidate division Zixibacteria bacterium]|nr:YraN family protein [candidate division Zixibacteria bacterium]
MPSFNQDSKNNRIKTGRSYEKLAAKFFEQKKFTIIERNYQAGHKEIDLIAKKENLVIFVEVKSAMNLKFGHPVERVDKKKIHNLSQAALDYLQKNNFTNCDFRFDVVTFTNGELEYFPNAFEFTED